MTDLCVRVNECGAFFQVIPPHGKATVDVVFTPTADAIRDLGRKPNGYVLGYLSIDKQVTYVLPCLRDFSKSVLKYFL